MIFRAIPPLLDLHFIRLQISTACGLHGAPVDTSHPLALSSIDAAGLLLTRTGPWAHTGRDDIVVDCGNVIQ
jgi:hypothetical protein